MGTTTKTSNKKAAASQKSAAIINQYQYTEAMMEEVQDALASQTWKNYIILIVITLICAFFTRREYITGKHVLSILFAVVAAGCLIAIIFAFVSMMKRKKAAVRQFHEEWGQNGFDYMITIEGVHIRSYRNNAPDADIRKSDVRAFFESERFFIFQLSGEKLLPLKKDAFIRGNLEDCRNYLPHLK